MSHPAAEELVQYAWDILPANDKRLLLSSGAAGWKLVDRSLDEEVVELLQSAGHSAETTVPASALAAWVPELRLVLIASHHPAIVEADAPTREHLLTWTAWHEWGHVLSVCALPLHDPREGERLLRLAPAGIKERIRHAGYSRQDVIHELFAETYALLIRERAHKRPIPPSWLPEEIYRLVASIRSE